MDQHISTTPLEPAPRPPGGKIKFGARLVMLAHTSSRNNTELKKYLCSEHFGCIYPDCLIPSEFGHVCEHGRPMKDC